MLLHSLLGHFLAWRMRARRLPDRDGIAYYLVSTTGLFSRVGAIAATFGAVVIARRELSDFEWRHERQHVRQYRRYGFWTPLRYFLLERRHGYEMNPMEREAREASWSFR